MEELMEAARNGDLVLIDEVNAAPGGRIASVSYRTVSLDEEGA